MIAFHFSAKNIQIDIKKYTEAQKKRVEEAVTASAKAFVIETKKHIPVYTGMASSSLLAFAEELGIHWAIKATPNAIRQYGPGGIRKKQQQGFNKSWFGIEWKGNVCKFYYQSDVRHLAMNDKYASPLKLTNPTPWHAFAQGRIAAKRAMLKSLNKGKLKIKDFIKVTGRVTNKGQ